jgi:hypothetical protein
MVVRREALQALGGFDVRFGPVGGRRYCEEDVDIVRRMLKAGRSIVYDPRLTVFHRIPRARMKRGYFRRVMWDMGEGRGLAAADTFPGPTLAGVPRWLFRYMAGLFARSTIHTLCGRPGAFEDMLECLLVAGTAWGQMKRTLRERRGAGGPERSSAADPVVRAPR